MKYLGLGLKAGYKNIKVDLSNNTLSFKDKLMDVAFLNKKVVEEYFGINEKNTKSNN